MSVNSGASAWTVVLVVLGAGCGGRAAPPAQQVTPPTSGSYVLLESEPGDYVGGGRSFLYTPADSRMLVNAVGGHLSLRIEGAKTWVGDFEAPGVLARLEPGFYYGLQRYYPSNPPVGLGGLDWYGERACNVITGSFSVHEVTYSPIGALTSIDMRFEQHCEGSSPALRGDVHWMASDTIPFGPIDPVPVGLWQPEPGSTPAAGNYVYLLSPQGDWIGLGQTYTYTQSNSRISVYPMGGHLRLAVEGDQRWQGDFQAMSFLGEIRPGYYGEPTILGNYWGTALSWSGEARGCNAIQGWFAVDDVAYSSGALVSIDLRFEQRCDTNPPLHGQIHWRADDTTLPPAPVDPPPSGLWQAAPGTTPSAGNYVHLESDAGDFIGGGRTFTYTQADSIIAASTSGNRFGLSIAGDDRWAGSFQAMYTLDRLQPGYYGELRRLEVQNPARGGLGWWNEFRSCNSLAGWFVVDAVTYSSGGVVEAIDLRFEQHCEGAAAALHGQIHWRADDPTIPPGPANPPPSGLWRPAPGTTPSSGSYVHLESDPGDAIGGGQTLTYPQISIGTVGSEMFVSVVGDQGSSGGWFWPMYTLARFEPGYYGDLLRFLGYSNPARGGLAWSIGARSCIALTGWFVVDSVSYASSGALEAIDLRFEQRCEGAAAALHGQVHWTGS